MNDNARVLVVSNRRFHPVVWRCAAFEAEDVISAVDRVAMVAPLARRRGQGRGTQFVQRAMRQAAGVTLAFDLRPEPVRLEGSYDLFIYIAQNPGDVAFLEAVPGWRRRCKYAVCFIEELWISELARARKLALLEPFDRILLPFRATAAPLAEKIGVPCEWLPPALDALRFCPWPDPPARTVDFFGMGRRSELTHRALREHAARRGWSYTYDTVFDYQWVRNPQEHRELLADTIKRSRYFMVNKAKIDAVAQTRGQEELAYRFVEGAAGGAVMIGDAPNAPCFTDAFDWTDAVIPLPYGATNIGDVLDELERQPQRLEQIRRSNVENVLRRHDWAHRWAYILGLAGLPPAPALQARLQRLEQLACEVGGRKSPVLATT